MSTALQIDKKFTYADYCGFSDDERFELIEGISYSMSPAPTRRHQQVSGEIYRILANFLDDKPCEVYIAPFDVRLTSDTTNNDEKVITVVQPDVSVICDTDKLDEKGCLGAPTLTIEVLSDATASKDLDQKFSLYQKYGVKEYWIVNLWSETITKHFDLENKKYNSSKIYKKSESLTSDIMKGLEINLTKVFK